MDDRFNTAAGWVLFAGIVALGGSIVSGMYFAADKHAHIEEPGFFIQGEAEEGGADAGPDLGTLLAAADPAAGEKVFAKCTACHTVNQGGANGIGPNLYGIIGKPIGKHAAGFAYSSALSDHGGDWSYENLDHWLANPRGFANGTKMSFAGLSKPEDRANVIAFLKANGGGPDYPAPAVPEADAAEGADAPGAGPGPVEGAEAGAAEAAGAMGADQPVAGDGAAASNDGGAKTGA
ncbi:cytochrome c family protein [Qipengyuania sp. YG27]|uniref:Cytochrome c family protein n=1 Tax=Qipengyuania mesophila TaxID=2867246 RepID=A0ABS7JVE0_9SPHN|nr:cytochrome c family protein [Qipengyuania mesophila]MBX7501615.1 cytochrome c family protein [Qipengyuania mesophila]